MMRMRPVSCHSRRRAFTLVDVMMTVTIIVVTAVLVIPHMGSEERTRVMAASRVLISDLEQAQVMTIAKPANPVVVRFESDGTGYWLAYADTPETPLEHALTGNPYRVVFGEGRASGAPGVRTSLEHIINETLAFNAMGGVEGSGDTPRIRLEAGSGSDAQQIDIKVSRATGTIRESRPE